MKTILAAYLMICIKVFLFFIEIPIKDVHRWEVKPYMLSSRGIYRIPAKNKILTGTFIL